MPIKTRLNLRRKQVVGLTQTLTNMDSRTCQMTTNSQVFAKKSRAVNKNKNSRIVLKHPYVEYTFFLVTYTYLVIDFNNITRIILRSL